MEFEATVTITEYGTDPKTGVAFAAAFASTHADVGAVVDQNTENGELSITFSYDADDLIAATARAWEIFAEGAAATGLPPTKLVSAHFAAVRVEQPVVARRRVLEPAGV